MAIQLLLKPDNEFPAISYFLNNFLTQHIPFINYSIAEKEFGNI